MQVDVLSMVEAAYRLDGEDQTWLKGVVDAAAPQLDRGLGVYAVLYQRPQVERGIFGEIYGVNLPPNYPKRAEAIGDALRMMPPEFLRDVFSSEFCDTTSHRGGPLYQLISSLAPLDGVHDIFTINAVDPTGAGCIINVQLPRRTTLARSVCEHWGRVGAHIAAGNRLRQRLRQEKDVADAVLSPDGKLHHAEEPAKGKDAQRVLRQAAGALDRARGKLRTDDPDAALGEWKGLVAARWTLVDVFESDGKHYLLARRNEAASPGLSMLSPREKQALGFAALGQPNKLIAYALGLSASTVAVLLHRAARKLDVHSRAELIAAYRALADADSYFCALRARGGGLTAR